MDTRGLLLLGFNTLALWHVSYMLVVCSLLV